MGKWKEIAEQYVKTRNAQQVKSHYHYYALRRAAAQKEEDETRNTGWWSEAEHNALSEGIEALGVGKWKEIAEQYVKTRTGVQVCNRYYALSRAAASNVARREEHQEMLESFPVGCDSKVMGRTMPNSNLYWIVELIEPFIRTLLFTQSMAVYVGYTSRLFEDEFLRFLTNPHRPLLRWRNTGFSPNKSEAVNILKFKYAELYSCKKRSEARAVEGGLHYRFHDALQLGDRLWRMPDMGAKDDLDWEEGQVHKVFVSFSPVVPQMIRDGRLIVML